MSFDKNEPITNPRLLSVKQAALQYSGTEWMWSSVIWFRELPVVEARRKQFLGRIDVDGYIEKQKKT